MDNDSGNRDTADGESSSCSEEPSSAAGDDTMREQRTATRTNRESKRFAAKELIERYFYQLLRGCGNPKCSNANCASSGKMKEMTTNEIAAKAIQLFSQDAKLCDVYNDPSAQSDSPTSCIIEEDQLNNDSVLNDGEEQRHEDYAESIAEHSTLLPPVLYLNEQILDEMIEECQKDKSYDKLVYVINEVFSSIEKLGESFCLPANEEGEPAPSTEADKLEELLGKPPSEFKKEDLRTLEGENDKDEDSRAIDEARAAALNEPDESSEPMDFDDDMFNVNIGKYAINSRRSDTLVDLKSVRRVKDKLFGLQVSAVVEAVNSNVVLLSESIKYSCDNVDWEKVLHCFVICFDMAANTTNIYADLEFLERALPKICHAARVLPIGAQARLARIWAAHCTEQLQPLLQCFQQLITLRVILEDECVQENPDIMAVTFVLKIAYYANILAGQPDTIKSIMFANEELADALLEDDDYFSYSLLPKSHQHSLVENQLEKELNITSMDCRIPLLPYEEFYNEPLSEAIQMDRDYLSYRNLSLLSTGELPFLNVQFSYMLYSFILTPATKVIALYYDSRIRMYSERNSSLHLLLNYYGDGSDAAATLPDLKLKVRRENIIDDALIGLEMIAISNPKDLKKQLVVEFIGEQGIDEGGVSKEFFQLIVDEIFNADFGMFIHQEDTNTVWFNSTPFENEAQFTLIGIILGLAIYNNIILAVNFPKVVYRKLLDGRGTFYDLEDWNPILFRSLKSMLDYEGDDMEEVFMQTFRINYTDVFGGVLYHDLKPNGETIYVEQHNKMEFVELYSDYLLNKSVQRQFKAFKRGFEMVTDESPLKLLFRPEEVELLVCGSRKFDFVELEQSTEYEGGYTKDTPIIKDFWSVVHSMPEESKRKLLEFTTGSDRVPVGGLSRLKLLITRHGPDTDRLPTSHTCFNVLLLPEYSSKEKLEERLLKAINYSKGFGML